MWGAAREKWGAAGTGCCLQCEEDKKREKQFPSTGRGLSSPRRGRGVEGCRLRAGLQQLAGGAPPGWASARLQRKWVLRFSL